MHTKSKFLLLTFATLFAGAIASLATPISGSLSFGVTATAHNQAAASDSNADSWSGSPGALAVGSYAMSGIPSNSAMAYAGGNATWAPDGNSGNMTINFGWDGTGADSFYTNNPYTNWTYSFTADANGNFVMNYDISAYGSNLFGLQGFFLYPANDLNSGTGAPILNVSNPTQSGTFVGGVTAGQTYTVYLANNGNISGSNMTISGNVHGVFDWSITSDTSSVPDTSATVALLGASFLGLAALRRRFVA